MRAVWCLGWLLCAACATTGGVTLETARACDDFAQVDAEVRQAQTSLLATAPGDVLVRETSRLNAARRACARHRLSVLRGLREEGGVEAVQRELDALAAGLSTVELEGLLREVWGEEAEQLLPLVAEARQRTQRHVADQQAVGRDAEALRGLAVEAPVVEARAPVMPDSMCLEATACAQLECVVKEGGAVALAAQRCLDAWSRGDAGARAEGIARVLTLLPEGVSGPRTEATLALERLRAERWPVIEQAQREGKYGLAAQWARPFAVLPRWRAVVERWVDQARRHHEARAKEKARGPLWEWLHLAIAASFGGDAPPAPVVQGRWAPTRWRCPGDAPPLPELPPAVDGVLSVRCDARAERKQATGSEDWMRTFELEGDLQRQQLKAVASFSCAGDSLPRSFTAVAKEDLVGGLTREVEEATRWCRQRLSQRSSVRCAELTTRAPTEVVSLFVSQARLLGRWEPCFVDWLAATEGAAPPNLEVAD